MTLSHYVLRPSLRARLLNFLVHHNPFFLLSALCMLLGCYAINSGLAPRTGDLPKLLALIGTLNLYEATLIALGLYLVRRGIIRDGRTLLLLEAPFLVDLAFLNADAGSVSVAGGLLLNLCVLALATAKVAIIFRTLWGRIDRPLFALIFLELAVLFLMPSALARLEHDNGLTAGHFYVAWWIVGVLLALYGLRGRIPTAGVLATPDPLRMIMRRLYALLPLASAIMHLWMQHWVYRVDFTPGNLSPLLVGLAFALNALGKRSDLRRLQIVLPLVALSLAMHFPPEMNWRILQVRMTPAFITGAAAYVAYVFCFFPRLSIPLLGGGAAVTAIALFGPTFQQMCFAVASAWGRSAWAIKRLLPQTAMQWGLAAVASGFGFLLVGAGISLKKAPTTQADGSASST